MILDHEGYKLCESIDRLEKSSGWCTSICFMLDVGLNANLRANSEEEGRDLLSFQNTLILKLYDKFDECLFDLIGLLVNSDPFDKAHGKLLSNSLIIELTLVCSVDACTLPQIIKQSGCAMNMTGYQQLLLTAVNSVCLQIASLARLNSLS